MALDILKEQRMIQTLFFSLINSAELLVDDKEKSEEFVYKVESFVREKLIVEGEESEVKDKIIEQLETLGWRNVVINYNAGSGTGEVYLGKNKYIVKDMANSDGVLLVIQGILEGTCYHLLESPVKANVSFTFSSGNHYLAKISKKIEKFGRGEIRRMKPTAISESAIHQNLKIESIFYPIISRDIPTIILFETTWKVISESFIANYSTEEDELLKEAIKTESMENMSRIIMKITEGESDEEIQNIAELLGEFIAKILATRVGGSLEKKLQSTLADKNAESYLIYYECRAFCAEREFDKRCTFIRSLWVGMLSEIFGYQMKIKEVFHAGKRDRYCMIELAPKKD
ncbi:MAG: hypothetical protein ACTSPK_02870 [Candidatus Heimdallarchaeota archaeon]